MNDKMRNGLYVLVGLLIFLVMLPELVRYSANYILSEQLHTEVYIDDIDLNLFSGRVSINNLEIEGENSAYFSLVNLSLDLGWIKSITDHWYVEAITIDGLSTRIIHSPDNEWYVPFALAPLLVTDAPSIVADDSSQNVDNESTIPLFTLSALDIINSNIELSIPDFEGELNIRQLAVNALSSASNQPASLVVDADWNDATISVDSSLLAFAKDQQFSGTLQLQGMTLGQFLSFMPPPTEAISGNVDLTVKVDASMGDKVNVDLDTYLALQDVNVDYGHLTASLSNVTIKTDMDLSGAVDQLTYEIKANANANNLLVMDKERQLLLAAFDAMTVQQLHANEQLDITLDQFSIQGMKAVGDMTTTTATEEKDKNNLLSSLLSFDSLAVNSMNVADGQSLTIETVDVEQLVSKILMKKEGGVAYQGALLASIQQFATSDETAVDEHESDPDLDPSQENEVSVGNGFTYVIDRVAVNGGQIQFVDQQFDKPVELLMNISEIQLQDLNSSKPDQPSPFNFSAKMGEFGGIDAVGDIAPLSEQLDVAIKGSLKGMSLPVISPYIESILAYELQSGQYDHSFDISVKDEAIDVDNELILRKLQIASKPEAKNENTIDVPLEFSLNLLRDSDDNIELDVPIHGKMDDPGFTVTNVIGLAIKNALASGSVTYLKFALQPYGAILMAAEMAVDNVNKGGLNLTPIVFEPMHSQLTQEGNNYSAKIAELLINRPGIELRLCGVAGVSDMAAYRAEMIASMASGQNPDVSGSSLTPEQLANIQSEDRYLALADERAATVKRLLVEKYAIAPERLFICKAHYDPAGEVAGVEIGL